MWEVETLPLRANIEQSRLQRGARLYFSPYKRRGIAGLLQDCTWGVCVHARARVCVHVCRFNCVRICMRICTDQYSYYHFLLSIWWIHVSTQTSIETRYESLSLVRGPSVSLSLSLPSSCQHVFQSVSCRGGGRVCHLTGGCICAVCRRWNVPQDAAALRNFAACTPSSMYAARFQPAEQLLSHSRLSCGVSVSYRLPVVSLTARLADVPESILEPNVQSCFSLSFKLTHGVDLWRDSAVLLCSNSHAYSLVYLLMRSTRGRC